MVMAEKTDIDMDHRKALQEGMKIFKISLPIGLLLHVAGLVAFYNALPPAEDRMEGPDALAYVALRAAPPVLLTQWLCNEAVAVANVLASEGATSLIMLLLRIATASLYDTMLSFFVSH